MWLGYVFSISRQPGLFHAYIVLGHASDKCIVCMSLYIEYLILSLFTGDLAS